ncbi:MAG: serine/threonine-protein kinase [Balneolaceae bacterium]
MESGQSLAESRVNRNYEKLIVMEEGMNHDHWKKLKEIFNNSLELEGAELEEYLDKNCGENQKLREEIESLLNAYKTPGVLDNPPKQLLESFFSSQGGQDKKGKHIGPYKIIKTLGYGGMGSVYLAKRADGQFEQEVALKLLRAGFTSKNQVRRFWSERQILATLNHENIARLLDGGVTEDGQPWFAMEYVKGLPIQKYCDAKKLSVKQRLKLFLKVCDAVQYAHQKLVVHRDLKPSNILVTEQQTVKLLDFGIAKVINHEDTLTNAIPLTRTGLLPLTPAYASPEQVLGKSMTTASDVYQLGIVLYELLTGCRPYNVSGKTPSEVEHIICEQQPTKPSTAIIKSLPEQENNHDRVNDSGKTKPGELLKHLRGDLDTIVLKALRKEPDRRYESAEKLASDIRYYLSGRPVSAHPDSMEYRAGKFIRRHKIGVSATAIIILLIVGYAATITWHSHRTQSALVQAQEETAKAEQVTGFLIDMFEASDPAEAMGDTLNTRLLLERGVAQAQQLDGQPDIQARMFDAAGRVYMALGQYEDARPLIERSLNLRKEIYGEDHLIVSQSLHNLAQLHIENGNYNFAGELYQESLNVRTKHLPSDDPRIAESLYHVGMYYQRVENNLETAESHLSKSLEIRQHNYGSLHEKVAESLRGLGGVLLAKGNNSSAETNYLKALEIQENKLGERHPETLTTLNNLAILKAWRGDYNSAISLLTESLDKRLKVLGTGHQSNAIQLNNLAFIAGHQGDYEEAEQLLNEAISVMRASVGTDHPHALVFKTNLARIKYITGDYENAEKLHRETLQQKRDLLGAGHTDVAASLVQLGALLKDQQKYTEAESLIREAISIHQNTLSDQHPMFISGYYLLAQIYKEMGDYHEAANLFHETLKIRLQTQAIDHTQIAVAHSLQGACLTDLELYTEAESLIKDVHSLLDSMDHQDRILKQELLTQVINLYERWDNQGQANRYRELLANVEAQSQ